MVKIIGIKNNNLKAYTFLVITASLWGSLYVVSRFVMNTVPPVTLLLIRDVIASIVLILFLKYSKFDSGKKKKIEKQDYKFIAVIGILGYFISISAQMIGTKLSSAGLASLLNSLNPIFILIFAIIILKEKITISKIISIIMALIGVYIIIGNKVSGNIGLGVIFSMVSVLSWSLTSILVKYMSKKYDSIALTTYSIIIAGVCTIPFSIYEVITSKYTIVFNFKIVLGIIYIGLICTALTNVLWNISLSLIDAGTCALFYPFQPVVATILGCIFLGETIGLSFVFGAILILSGVILSVLADKYKKDLSVTNTQISK